jgi:hypothetical protein
MIFSYTLEVIIVFSGPDFIAAEFLGKKGLRTASAL